MPLTDPSRLDDAFQWLCAQRKRYSPNNDIWGMKPRWNEIKTALQKRLIAGDYQLAPMRRYRFKDQIISVWSALDAIVLKALSEHLTSSFETAISKRCYHVKNHGGVKGAIRDIQSKLPDYPFVFKTDVKDYYASIDHSILHEQLAERIKDKGILRLLWQMMRRVETWGGLFWSPQRGIPRGCSLSPLMGAIYLSDLDHAFEKKNRADKVQYFRYQDDILILAKTRWHLRKAIKIIKQHFSKLKVEKHPDKTFVGRTTREFDFLGYHFDAQKIIGIAQASLDRFIGNMRQLHEQQSSLKRLDDYWRRWTRWIKSALKLAPDILNNIQLTAESLLLSFTACPNSPGPPSDHHYDG